MIIRADFHLHSCLSPCGDLAMSPTAIVETLEAKGVQLAALTDHNSSLNCPAFETLCIKAGIVPLSGMEAQTAEEVHVLCLFPNVKTALVFGQEIYDQLPPVMNNPEKTGDQIYVDEEENILGEVEKYLITSAVWGIDELASQVHKLGGLVIPAHVDRAAFSLTSQLGFVPEGAWDALEVVRMPLPDAQPGTPGRLFDTLDCPLTTSSDAHYTEHIARRAFDLDIGDTPLTDAEGHVLIETVRNALQKRPR